MIRRKGNLVLLTLICTVILGVAYAMVSNVSLTISDSGVRLNENLVQEDFKVRFIYPNDRDAKYINGDKTKATYVSETSGIDKSNVSISVDSDTVASFNIDEDMTDIGDSVTLVYNVVNESSDLYANFAINVDNDNLDCFKVTSQIEKSSLKSNDVSKVIVRVELISIPKFDTDGKFKINITATPSEVGNSIVNDDNIEIIFDSNGGNSIDSQFISKGNVLSLIPTPVKTNYNFKGWYSDIELTNLVDNNTIFTNNTILYAKWEEIAKLDEKTNILIDIDDSVNINSKENISICTLLEKNSSCIKNRFDSLIDNYEQLLDNNFSEIENCFKEDIDNNLIINSIDEKSCNIKENTNDVEQDSNELLEDSQINEIVTTVED